MSSGLSQGLVLRYEVTLLEMLGGLEPISKHSGGRYQ